MASFRMATGENLAVICQIDVLKQECEESVPEEGNDEKRALSGGRQNDIPFLVLLFGFRLVRGGLFEVWRLRGAWSLAIDGRILHNSLAPGGHYTYGFLKGGNWGFTWE